MPCWKNAYTDKFFDTPSSQAAAVVAFVKADMTRRAEKNEGDVGFACGS